MKNFKKKSIPLHPKADLEVNAAIQRWKDGEGDPEISGIIDIVFEATADFERDIIQKESFTVTQRANGMYAFLLPVSKIDRLLEINPEYLHYVSLKKKSRPRS